MGEDLKVVLLLIWLGVALVVAVATWISNGGVYYVNRSPPSPILSGLAWPLTVVVIAVLWAVHMMSDASPSSGDE